MKSRDFCYWLQGYFELTENSRDSFTNNQLELVKKHLALVFKYEIDPEAGDQRMQDALNALHTKPIKETPAYSSSNNDVLIRC